MEEAEQELSDVTEEEESEKSLTTSDFELLNSDNFYEKVNSALAKINSG